MKEWMMMDFSKNRISFKSVCTVLLVIVLSFSFAAPVNAGPLQSIARTGCLSQVVRPEPLKSCDILNHVPPGQASMVEEIDMTGQKLLCPGTVLISNLLSRRSVICNDSHREIIIMLTQHFQSSKYK